jgi:hypothetical protein
VKVNSITPTDVIEALRRTLVRPVSILIVISILVTAALLYVSAVAEDAAVTEASERLASTFVDVRLTFLRRTLRDIGRWIDDADIARLVPTLDKAWTDANFGRSFAADHDLAFAVVAAGPGQALYSYTARDPIPDLELLEPILSRARGAEARSEPVAGLSPRPAGRST